MRWILLLGVAWLSACSYLPSVKKMTPHPQPERTGQPEIVLVAIEQYQLSGETELLQQLVEQMPDSEWARYANALLTLSAELKQLEGHEVDCSRFVAEKKTLQQENEQLNQTIEQLKKLLIELEKRSQ